MLTGLPPFDETGPPSAIRSDPSGLIRSTEIWLLPASTTSRNRPSGLSCSDPCDAVAWPVPAAADRERRARDRSQRPVGVAVVARDGVRTRGVVVDVDLPDDARRRRDRARRDRRHGRHDGDQNDETKLLHPNPLRANGETLVPHRRPRCQRRAYATLAPPMNVFLNRMRHCALADGALSSYAAVGRLNETRAPP